MAFTRSTRPTRKEELDEMEVRIQSRIEDLTMSMDIITLAEQSPAQERLYERQGQRLEEANAELMEVRRRRDALRPANTSDIKMIIPAFPTDPLEPRLDFKMDELVLIKASAENIKERINAFLQFASRHRFSLKDVLQFLPSVLNDLEKEYFFLSRDGEKTLGDIIESVTKIAPPPLKDEIFYTKQLQSFQRKPGMTIPSVIQIMKLLGGLRAELQGADPSQVTVAIVHDNIQRFVLPETFKQFMTYVRQERRAGRNPTIQDIEQFLEEFEIDADLRPTVTLPEVVPMNVLGARPTSKTEVRRERERQEKSLRRSLSRDRVRDNFRRQESKSPIPFHPDPIRPSQPRDSMDPYRQSASQYPNPVDQFRNQNRQEQPGERYRDARTRYPNQQHQGRRDQTPYRRRDDSRQRFGQDRRSSRNRYESRDDARNRSRSTSRQRPTQGFDQTRYDTNTSRYNPSQNQMDKRSRSLDFDRRYNEYIGRTDRSDSRNRQQDYQRNRSRSRDGEQRVAFRSNYRNDNNGFRQRSSSRGRIPNFRRSPSPNLQINNFISDEVQKICEECGQKTCQCK